jgi:hypothetical protein
MQQFREAIERGRMIGKADEVVALLAEDVVFRSPVVFKPYEGRAAVEPLLRAVVRVFDEFHFTRQISNGSDHALVFGARIGERNIEGCDFLHTDAAGFIDEFYVMVRPLSGVMALADAMKQQLAIQKTKPAP